MACPCVGSIRHRGLEEKLTVTCGIDWAEVHHDIAILDSSGHLLAKRRITDDLSGWEALQQLFADHGDSAEDPIPVAIETGKGLLVACLRASGRKVYAINSLAWRAIANGTWSRDRNPTTRTR